MGLKLVRNLGPIKRAIYSGWYWDAQNKIDRIQPILNRSGKIADIGSGYGTVTDLLQNQGYDIVPVDVEDHSIREDLKPICYDGSVLPFSDDKFDQTLLLTVLHHTKKPEAILAEAARVSREIIVIEDVYRNKVQQYLTYFADSVFNFEFIGHPHTNKTREGWSAVCEELGLKMKVIRSDRFLLFFRQETYLIGQSI